MREVTSGKTLCQGPGFKGITLWEKAPESKPSVHILLWDSHKACLAYLRLWEVLQLKTTYDESKCLHLLHPLFPKLTCSWNHFFQLHPLPFPGRMDMLLHWTPRNASCSRVLGLTGLGLRKTDCVILTTHFRQSILVCLHYSVQAIYIAAIITNDIYLSMFVSTLGKGHILFISAFTVSSSVTWQAQEPSECLPNWNKKFYNGGIEQSQLTWAPSFKPGLFGTAPHHWRPAVQLDSWALSIWATPWWSLGNSAFRPPVGGGLPLSATQPWLLDSISVSTAHLPSGLATQGSRLCC